MPTALTSDPWKQLTEMLGERLRLARRRRGKTAEALAAEAGITRVTLRRVEAGEPTVALGIYARVMAALGLAQDLVLLARDDDAGRRLQDEALLRNRPSEPPRPRVPKTIRLAQYPALRQLAWSTDPKASVTPEEAFALYERNWRHLDHEALTPRERLLVDGLTRTVGRGVLLV